MNEIIYILLKNKNEIIYLGSLRELLSCFKLLNVLNYVT